MLFTEILHNDVVRGDFLQFDLMKYNIEEMIMTMKTHFMLSY